MLYDGQLQTKDSGKIKKIVCLDESAPVSEKAYKELAKTTIPKNTGRLYPLSPSPIKYRQQINVPMKPKKIKLLWYGDSPTANTGFGCVSRNVLAQLHKSDFFDITVLGIQYFEDPEVDLYKREDMPYRIISAGNNHDRDMFGRKKLLSLIGREHFDLIVTFQDLCNLDMRRVKMESIRAAINKSQVKFKKRTRWLIYTPIDGQLKPFELQPIKDADLTVLYTKFGYQEVIKTITKEGMTKTSDPALQRIYVNEVNKKLHYIYHGIDTSIFKPIKREKLLGFRKEYFNIEPEDFLIINVNRNQSRKALPHTIEAYTIAKQENKNINLYLHCRETDVGGRLASVLEAYDYPDGIQLPKNLDVIKGVSDETLNKIYNCADLYITTTLGEGWGLTVTEAMACKVPVIIPPHSSLTEIGECGRAIFSSFASNTISHEDFYRLRPATNTMDLASKIGMVIKNKDNENIKEITNKAYKWVKKLTWDNIGKEWIGVIRKLMYS